MSENIYADRDHEQQGAHYLRHIDRMTVEKLNSKSSIAGELAHRDAQIADMRVALEFSKADNLALTDMYLRLTDAAGYTSGKDGLEFSPEEWMAALNAKFAANNKELLSLRQANLDLTQKLSEVR